MWATGEGGTQLVGRCLEEASAVVPAPSPGQCHPRVFWGFVPEIRGSTGRERVGGGC